MNFAKTLTDNSETDVSIMMQARKALLFNDSKPWLEKFGSEDFDVVNGVLWWRWGLWIRGFINFNKVLRCFTERKCGVISRWWTGNSKTDARPRIRKKKKKDIEIFKKYGLAITIKTNLFVVNFLDIQFNLLNGTFKPYRKPNNDPIYVHKDSNHLLQVLKELPKTIGKRISTISSSTEIFESSKIEYENALKISGYKDRLVYENSSVNENDKNEKKKRRESAILFGKIHHTQLM